MKKLIIAVLVVVGLALIAARYHTCQKTAQFKPCVWPNTCADKVAATPITTCVWPNTCAS